MAVKLQADVNANNRKLRTKASAGGGDGKFIAISALHGCYCLLDNCRGHQGGYGCFVCVRKAADGETPVEQGPGVCGFDCMMCDCNCWCVFQEHNKQKIATGVMREKKRLEDAKKIDSGGCDASPEATRRTAWTEFVMSVIENCNACESQHVNSCSFNEQLQDIALLAALDAYLDPTMVQDANVSRGLRKMIPLSQNVNCWAANGTTRPLTFGKSNGG
jgi:hypothetical protein